MHGGLVPSYSDARVTKETVLGVLTCNMSAIGDGPCLKTLRGDRILVYWAGHGGDKMLLMPSGEPLCGPSFVQCRFTYNGAWNEALYRFADELLEGLTQLWKRGYSQLVFYLEACDSASLFESYDTQLRSLSILAVTASRAAENAYATYVLIPQPLPSRYASPVLVFVPNHVSDRYCCDYFRPPSCTVAGEDIGACLGDLWSAFIWEDIDLGSANETLRTQIAASKEKILPKGDQVPACLAIVCGLTPRISHWDPRL